MDIFSGRDTKKYSARDKFFLLNAPHVHYVPMKSTLYTIRKSTAWLNAHLPPSLMMLINM